MSDPIAREIERFLATGDTDPVYRAWSGDVVERRRRARADLRGALVGEVTRRSEGHDHPAMPTIDRAELARWKLRPMVHGLFPRAEHEAVLSVLERAIAFVDRSTLDRLVREVPFDGSAWALANLYLEAVGAELLGAEAPHLLGFAEGTTCYVSPLYFAETDPFADFLVHEAAHLFHNVKRRDAGLRATRTREWLLDIAYRRRETFAYACESYSRILERAQSPAERRALAESYASTVEVCDDRVDATQLGELVTTAAAARNGWKKILEHCTGDGTGR